MGGRREGLQSRDLLMANSHQPQHVELQWHPTLPEAPMQLEKSLWDGAVAGAGMPSVGQEGPEGEHGHPCPVREEDRC